MSQAYKGTPFDLTGRAVLISGAAGLLGREFALAAASAGAHLVLGDLNGDKLESLKSEITSLYPDSEVLVHILDVVSAESCQSIAEACETRFNRVPIPPAFQNSPSFRQNSGKHLLTSI